MIDIFLRQRAAAKFYAVFFTRMETWVQRLAAAVAVAAIPG